MNFNLINCTINATIVLHLFHDLHLHTFHWEKLCNLEIQLFFLENVALKLEGNLKCESSYTPGSEKCSRKFTLWKCPCNIRWSIRRAVRPIRIFQEAGVFYVNVGHKLWASARQAHDWLCQEAAVSNVEIAILYKSYKNEKVYQPIHTR